MALTKIGATLGGSADVITVTQSSHGLYLGYPVKMTSSGYAHATADTAANAEAVGIVIATDRTGANTTFSLALGGRVTVDGCVPNLATGTVLFLQVSAGLLAAVEPSGNNQVSKPMAVITIANSEMIMVQQRGEVISTAGITLADGSVDNDAMADDAINTDEIVADAVTNAKLANMAAYTIKGNATSSSANPTDISLASATGGYSIDDADIVLVYDANGSALKTITRANFVAGIGGGTAPVFGRVKRTSADVTTTSTSLVDFTGASITFTTGAFPIAYGQIATSRNSTAGAMIAYNVLIDSTLELGTTGIATDHYPANYNADYSFTGQSAALSAASHTIKLQWRVSAGTALGNADTGYAHIFWAHEIR